MKKFVPILALVLLQMISNGDSDEFTSSAVTQIAADYKTHSSSIYEIIPAVARIVTAITLQNGLSDGSIKADDFIVDLLNVGSISLVDLEKFNSETANALIKQLNRNYYKNKLEKLNYVEIIEKSIIDIHEIVGKWNILKLKLRKVPTKRSFAKLNKVNNWKNVFKIRYVNINELILMLDEFIEDKNVEYESLKDRLKPFVDSVPSATNQYKNVKSLLLSLIPFCDFFDLTQQLDRMNRTFPPPFYVNFFISDINSTLDNVENIIPSDVSPSLAIVKKMLSWHSRRPSLTAPGFLNGYMDLKKLENEMKYSWINDAIVSIKDVYSVELLDVWRLMFGNNINAVSTPENRRIIDQLNTLKVSAVSWTYVNETFEKVRGCPVIKDIRGTPIERSISSLSLQIRMLLKVIYALEAVSILITEKHKALITDLSAETKKADIRELADIIKLLKASIEIIQRGKPEYSIAQIQSNKDYITTFNDYYYVQSFNRNLECLAGIGEPLRTVSRTLLATSTFRRLIENNRNNSDYDKRLNDIFMAIEKSRLWISHLRAIAKTIQKDKSDNVLKLRNLSGLEPYRKPLAEAATVLVMIKRAKELKNEFASFMTDGEFIQSTIDGYSNQTFKKVFLKYWGNFDNTILEIVTFFAYINAWDEKLGKSSSTGITEYGNSLKELATVPSVELDVQRKTIGVEKFLRVNNDTNVKSALVRLDGCLWKLSNLDLQFAGYRKSLEQMPDTLANVFKVFHEQAEGRKEEEDGGNMMIFWCLFVGVCAIVLIAVIIWCYLDENSIYHTNKHKCCQKEPEMKTAIEGGPPPGWKPPVPKETEKFERRINPKREERSGERPKEGKPCSVSLAVGNSCLQKSLNVAPLKETSASPFTDKDTDNDSALGSPNTSKMEK